MSSPATFLGPVDELPPEGNDIDPGNLSEVDYCAAMFSDSSIGFDVSRDGVTVVSNPQATETFQQFQINAARKEDEPYIVWNENAFDIHMQGLFRDRNAFSTLSDASEPEDFVRRFLEVLASSLDDPAIGHDGATVPLIRWQPGEDENSARVQLLGFLLADENQFEQFCADRNGEFGFIFEDAEVQAHGIREAVTALALLGITLGATTQAEAGLFKNLKKNREARAEQISQMQAIQRAQQQAAIQQTQSGWRDVHQDAYVNQQLLDSHKDGEKKIVVDISRQRVYMIVDGQVAIDTACSTARANKYTPRGTFKITERIEHGKHSTIYGCEMPYWQRLGDSAIGLHIGDLPGYPASAGCIRLPYSIAPVIFSNSHSGLEVKVVDSWDQQELHQGAQQNILVAQVVQQDNNS